MLKQLNYSLMCLKITHIDVLLYCFCEHRPQLLIIDSFYET